MLEASAMATQGAGAASAVTFPTLRRLVVRLDRAKPGHLVHPLAQQEGVPHTIDHQHASVGSMKAIESAGIAHGSVKS